MYMANNASRDENRVPTLLGVDSIQFKLPTTAAVDPTTHEVLVKATIGATNFFYSTNNSTTTQLGAGATFTGVIESILSYSGISILLTSDQNGTLTINQYIDAAGVYKTSSWVYSITAGTSFNRSFVANGNYMNVVFTNNGASPTTTFNLNTAFGSIQPSTALGNEAVGISEVGGVAITTGSGVPVSTKMAITPSAPTTYTVTTTTGQALAANASRKGLIIVNLSDNIVYLGIANSAVLNSGIALNKYGAFSMDEYTYSTGAINAITTAGGATLSIQEYA